MTRISDSHSLMTHEKQGPVEENKRKNSGGCRKFGQSTWASFQSYHCFFILWHRRRIKFNLQFLLCGFMIVRLAKKPINAKPLSSNHEQYNLFVISSNPETHPGGKKVSKILTLFKTK